MTPLPGFSVTVRAATDAECALTDGMANAVDGAGALLVNNVLVAICNEYGTCVLHPNAERETPEYDRIEKLVDLAVEVLTDHIDYAAQAAAPDDPDGLAASRGQRPHYDNEGHEIPMSTIEKSVTVNHDQGLYVIGNGSGYSCLGFDVCIDRIERIKLELEMRGALSDELAERHTVARGDIATYDTYIILLGLLEAQCKRDGYRAIYALSPQLVGLEGHRVEVEQYGETRRFIVGKSTGWAPIHLEIARRNSSGGGGASMEYERVTDLGKVR